MFIHSKLQVYISHKIKHFVRANFDISRFRVDKPLGPLTSAYNLYIDQHKLIMRLFKNKHLTMDDKILV